MLIRVEFPTLPPPINIGRRKNAPVISDPISVINSYDVCSLGLNPLRFQPKKHRQKENSPPREIFLYKRTKFVRCVLFWVGFPSPQAQVTSAIGNYQTRKISAPISVANSYDMRSSVLDFLRAQPK